MKFPKIQADSFEELAEIAIARLRAERHRHIVCGPITTGGRGDLEINLKVFEVVIRSLSAIGHPVFDQIKYEPEMWRLQELWFAENPGNTYCKPILDLFYARIFGSGCFEIAHFIPGWETSTGAKWERELLSTLGVQIVDLDHEWVNSLMTDSE